MALASPPPESVAWRIFPSCEREMRRFFDGEAKQGRTPLGKSQNAL